MQKHAENAAGGTVGQPVFLTADTVKQVLDWPAVIECMRSVYRAAPKPETSPPRVVARGEGVALRALAAAPLGQKFMGAKVFGRGRNRGIEYVIVLLDQATGKIAGFVDANPITAFRTAATSALGVDCLMQNKGPIRVGVLGSGLEARSHIAAMAAVRKISEIKVFSPTPKNREAFARDIGAELGVDCRPAESGAAAAEGADLVLAASRSRDESPILLGEWLTPGMTVVSIGSTLPEQREADVAALDKCDVVVCDSVEEVGGESGDVIAARAEGVPIDGKLISLADVVNGCLDISALRLPMFKSVGAAVQDVATAELAYDLALAKGLQIPLPIAFMDKS